jgi:manganese/zinc/iron transport system ATP- binding protein
MNKQQPSIIVDQLTVTYEEAPVLWNLHFSIPSGRLVGIIGPNGAGKSTLFKTFIGLLKPISGKVEFFGSPFKKMRKKIAYVPQRSSVDWDFPVTVLDVVIMGSYGRLGWFKRPKLSDKESAMRALEMLGMQSFADRQISELSGGQQQRVFLARALLQDADIFLMDEPFAGIDLATEKVIIALLKKLKSEGKTLLVVHHDLSNVLSTFDWVIMLNKSLIACGPAEEVFHAENIMRAFGRSEALLEEAVKISQNKTKGIS